MWKLSNYTEKEKENVKFQRILLDKCRSSESFEFKVHEEKLRSSSYYTKITN